MSNKVPCTIRLLCYSCKKPILFKNLAGLAKVGKKVVAFCNKTLCIMDMPNDTHLTNGEMK